MDGELNCSSKFRILRNGLCIADGLTIHTMKKFKNDVDKVELGNECGLAFNGLKSVLLEEGDLVECYKEKELEPEKFNYKLGLTKSY